MLMLSWNKKLSFTVESIYPAKLRTPRNASGTDGVHRIQSSMCDHQPPWQYNSGESNRPIGCAAETGNGM